MPSMNRPGKSHCTGADQVPFERCLPLQPARVRLENSLLKLGIRWELETTGRLFKTSKCSLFDSVGNILDRGFGKGEAEVSAAGSMFEATEHWFARFENCNASVTTHCDSFKYANDARLPNTLLAQLIRDSGRASIALRSYKSLSGGADQLYPVGLSSPSYIDKRYESRHGSEVDCFDYSRIEAYSSNSGSAIGSTELDATIHGLLEVVERDSLSNFLVDAFLQRNAESMKVVARASLPEDLTELVRLAEMEVENDVTVLQLDNKFGIPCFCAALMGSQFPIEVTGFGCSLSRRHAFRRCIYELVQCYHITDKFYPSEFIRRTEQILARLSRFPLHLRCAKMKIQEWSEAIGFESISYEGCSKVNYPDDAAAYLAQLVKLIEHAGHGVYSSVLAVLPNGEIAVHCLFERQEHFFCAMEGSFVLPDPSRWTVLSPVQIAESSV